MVSSRDVIGLAVSVIDAVDAPDAVPARDLPATFEALVASWSRDGVSGPVGVGREPAISFDQDVLAAEIRPLVVALVRHLHLVLAGRAAHERAPSPDGATDASRLTARETEALVLLARGHTAAATARRMGCSLSTANKHLGNVYRKLGVGDRLAAVLEAQRRGILPADPTGARPAAR